MAGLLQHIDAMSAPLQGAAAGASELTLPKIDEIGNDANVMVAYAIIWALRKAGVQTPELQDPADGRLRGVVSNINRYGMAHEFSENSSLVVRFAAPLDAAEKRAALQYLKQFKEYASRDWVAVDAEQARRNRLVTERYNHAIHKEYNRQQGIEPPAPTLSDIPVQPNLLGKPLGDGGDDAAMHDVLFLGLV